MRRVQTLTLAMCVSLMLLGCATIGPPQPPSLNLPKPPADLRAKRKGDRVNLTWTIPTTTTDREIVRQLGSTLICRGPGELSACGTQAGEINTPIPPATAPSARKPQASYSDTLPVQLESNDPSASITYAVQVLNREGRAAGLSNQIRISLIRTLPAPRQFGAVIAKEGVVLNWSTDPLVAARTDLQYVYRVYRHAEGSTEDVLAAETSASAEASHSLIDANIEWQKTYYYHAVAVTRVHQANGSSLEVEGDDTPEAKVFAADLFPPAVPSDLQAVFSGPGQESFVDLVWAPVTDADLAGYNIYRHEEGGSPVKLNGELVKAPAYRDENVSSGKTYFYSVSAVDVRGNESAQSEEASERVP